MCGGSDAPQAPNIPPPPPVKDLPDVIDRIAGVTSVLTKDPISGKEIRETKRLPRSEEEQRFFEKAGEMMAESMASIQQLAQNNPAEIVPIQPFINTVAGLNQQRQQDLAQIGQFGNIQETVDRFRGVQKTLLEEKINQQNLSLEGDLRRRGLSRSTSGDQRRALALRQQLIAKQEVDLMSQAYGENLQQSQYERNINQYNQRQLGRDALAQQAQLDYTLQQQRQQDILAQRNQRFNEQYGLLNVGSTIRNQDYAKAMGSQLPMQNLQEWNAMENQKMNRYNAQVNAQQQNYQNQMLDYQNRPPSFGSMVGKIGTQAGMAYLSGGTSLGTGGTSLGTGKSFLGIV